jgi:uncharacterized protein YcfL
MKHYLLFCLIIFILLACQAVPPPIVRYHTTNHNKVLVDSIFVHDTVSIDRSCLGLFFCQ